MINKKKEELSNQKIYIQAIIKWIIKLMMIIYKEKNFIQNKWLNKYNLLYDLNKFL